MQASFQISVGEDNKCACEMELAARLYTYSCSLGCTGTGDQEDNKWFCWNGLGVCEIGVPMPHTQASFLSPFLLSNQVAFLCPIHGPDGAPIEKAKRKAKDRLDSKSSVMEGNSDLDEPEKPTRSSSMKTASFLSTMDGGLESCAASEAGNSDNEEEEDSESRRSWSFNTQSGLAGVGKLIDKEKAASRTGHKCTCSQYIFAAKPQLGAKPQSKQGKGDGLLAATEGEAAKLRQALAALPEYDILHTFAALISGGLNLAKSVLRLHFSIGPGRGGFFKRLLNLAVRVPVENLVKMFYSNWVHLHWKSNYERLEGTYCGRPNHANIAFKT